MNQSHSLKQIGNIDLVKQLNSAVVYSLIDQQGPISRIQIAEQSQLAPASVTKITRQLLERGLIKEVDQQASTGPPEAVALYPSSPNTNISIPSVCAWGVTMPPSPCMTLAEKCWQMVTTLSLNPPSKL